MEDGRAMGGWLLCALRLLNFIQRCLEHTLQILGLGTVKFRLVDHDEALHWFDACYTKAL